MKISNKEFYAKLESIEIGLSEKYKYNMRQYWKNNNNKGQYPLGKIIKDVYTFRGILYGSFIFYATPESHEYWNNIANKLDGVDYEIWYTFYEELYSYFIY